MEENLLSDFTLAVHAELRGWKGKRNISQRSLADRAGISKSKLSRMIGKDEQAIDTDELDALCKVLGVSPEIVIDNAVRALERYSYALAAKEAPAPEADINEEDYL